MQLQWKVLCGLFLSDGQVFPCNKSFCGILPITVRMHIKVLGEKSALPHAAWKDEEVEQK